MLWLSNIIFVFMERVLFECSLNTACEQFCKVKTLYLRYSLWVFSFPGCGCPISWLGAHCLSRTIWIFLLATFLSFEDFAVQVLLPFAQTTSDSGRPCFIFSGWVFIAVLVESWRFVTSLPLSSNLHFATVPFLLWP